MRVLQLVGVAALCVACGSGGSSSSPPAQGTADLFAKDPLRHDYDFVRDAYGAAMQNGQIVNVGSHIDFGTYNADAFTVGIQGGQIGAIVDLGDDAQVAAAVGNTETVGGGQGYAGLTLSGGSFNLPAANAVYMLTTADAGATSDDAPVVQNHVYALRIIDRDTPGAELVVKLLVTGFTSGTEASFEWTRLVANGKLD
jgi:hypothetical protein